jgi:hypothetical protein
MWHFDRLAGQWELERTFEGLGASLKGSASFTPAGPQTLAYRETGQLTHADGSRTEAYRNYVYRLAGDALEIDFGDGPDKGTLFVRLEVSAAAPFTASATHHCGDDIYAVRYRFDLPAAFETDITVAGPKKAYRALSRYVRKT